MKDGIDAHPWSRLHLPTAPEASSARAPSIEVINKAHLPSMAVTAMAPPAVKVEQVVGDIEMGDGDSNNNNVVSKAIVKGKGKGKERVVIEEVEEDMGQEVTVKTVAKEAKGKGKVKEVGEERAVKQGKGKGKGKEVVQEEGVAEQTMVTEKSKNKGKWRESSKGTKKTRGHSQSTATSKFKSAELVPSDSEDECTGLTPRGPSPTPLSVQPWPTCDFCITKCYVYGKGPGLACINCHRRKHERSRSRLPPTETASTPQSQAPPPLKKARLSDMAQEAGPSKPHKERFNRVVIPLPSCSFSRSSVTPCQLSPKPKASTAAPPASSDEVIANLQAKVWMLRQRVANRARNHQTLTTVVEAMRRHLMTLPVPLPTSANVDLMASLLRHGPEGPLPENQEGGGYNTPSALSVDSPPNPLPPLPTILKLTVTPTVLLPPPMVLAPLPTIPRQSAPPAPSPSLRPPSEDIAWSSAPPIAVLSAPRTPSSGLDIVTTPKADMQAPGPAGAPEALPVTIGAAEAGQPPRAVSPMDDVQATPRVTALEVDTRSTTAMGSAVQEQHAAVPISATQVDAQVDVVEAEGVAEPSTSLALPVQLPPPSPEHRATALLALMTAYDNEEQMEVDN
ncbi:hypothetical protein PAXRUDRAFT_19142 [Paxillus rubicundulus Ve08.2h10]|uniref:Unplaced genomic scaffold scaffold_3409, whole genome shotgun sequence n=1 Tax=Paxillus rubicundulus Ve08.2h10 TaxID=930991 RepID=A0A0D0CJ87_9AGAM|nr:hypothetical protein PAXRUDRAFT_19142 [Paxillus rubicundulus Ve08.2h10]